MFSISQYRATGAAGGRRSHNNAMKLREQDGCERRSVTAKAQHGANWFA